MISPLVLHYFSTELQKEAGWQKAVGEGVEGAVRRAGGHAGNAARWVGNMTMSAPKAIGEMVYGLAVTPRETLAKGFRTMAGNPLMSSAGVVGLGYGASEDMKNKETVSGRQRGLGERVGRVVGGVTTGIAGMHLGMMSGMATGMGGEAAGGLAGRAVDTGIKKLLHKPAPSLPVAQ